jgi:dTDP-4-dehydrorhamnose reductase
MLGYACKLVLSADPKIQLVTTSRQHSEGTKNFNAGSDSVDRLIQDTNPDWIINCIGVIKPHINEDSLSSVENAIQINSVFPHSIANAVAGSKIKVIQIATDCVYSGKLGNYDELSIHDANDVYGKTKSLGEVKSDQFIHLRASIIGPEIGRSTSLLEWFLGQPIGTTVNGFTDHLWNGLTTHHFAVLAKAVMNLDIEASGVNHVLPGNQLTKAQLLEVFAEVYSRKDIQIKSVISSNKIDRTLSTRNMEFSNLLWKTAGYSNAPTINQMVLEQKNFIDSHK